MRKHRLETLRPTGRRIGFTLVAILVVWIAGRGAAPPSTSAPPAATPASSPSPSPSRIDPIVRTPRPRPTRRPTKTPSSTPTLAPLLNPLPIGRSLEDAGREVLSWLDPSRSPRVERARIISKADFLATWEDDEPPAYSYPFDAPREFSSSGAEVFIESLPSALMIIEASTRSIDAEAANDPEWRFGPCGPAGEFRRERILVVFDAVQGTPLLAEPLDTFRPAMADSWWMANSLDVLLDESLRAAPTATRVYNAQPVPTSSPTALPERVPLSRSNLSPGLAQVFRSYPLRPGSSWTWRVTHRHNGTRWAANVITETVESAWLTQGTALMRMGIETTSIRPRHRTFRLSGVPEGSEVYRSLSETVFLSRLNLERGLSPTDLPIVIKSDHDHFAPYHTPHPLVEGSIATDITVDTLAGTFNGCTRFIVLGGASWSTYRWFCPGVGYVRDETYACGPSGPLLIVSELVRWTIADW